MAKTEETSIALPDDVTTAVSARLFGAIAPYRAKHDIRWYLNGVHLMPNPSGPGVFVVATNGHQLAIAFDAEGRAAKTITLTCSAGLATAARAARNKPGSHVALQADRVRVLSALLEERFVQPGPAEIEAAKYPDVLRVLQPALGELQAGMHGAYNPRYLELLNKTAADLSGKHALPLTHWTTADGASLYSRFESEPDLLVVTMSMRGAMAQDGFAPAALRRAIEVRRDEFAAENAAKAAKLAAAAQTQVNADAEAQPA